MRISDWSSDVCSSDLGFGADLGAEKFFDIKCRKAGLKPNAVVIVATVRALKMHGGVAKDALGDENVDAVKKGCANLGRHISNVKKFGVPAVIAINRFVKDTDAELKAITEFVKRSEEHTSELQSVMRISYAVFCLTKK